MDKDKRESNEPEREEEVREDEQVDLEELGSKDELMKLSQLLATDATINQQVASMFQIKSLQLMSTASNRLKVKDRDWLSDYLANQHLMYERLFSVNNLSQNSTSQGPQDSPIQPKQIEQDHAANKKQAFGSAYLFQTPPNVSRTMAEERDETPPLSVSGASFISGANRDNLAAAFEAAIPKIKLNELVQKPEMFNGNTPPARRWLDDYERAAEANAWTNQLKVRYFSTFLEKAAHDWHITIARRKLGINPEWSDLRAAFIRHYLGDSDRRILRQQLEACRQGDSEKAINFIPRVMRLIQLINNKMHEDECVEIIRDKLRREFKDKLTLVNIYTLEELNDHCLKIESEIASRKSIFKTDERKREQKPKNFQRSEQFNNNRPSRNSPNNPRPSSSSKTQGGIKTCYRCDRKGHVSSNCFALTKLSGELIPRNDGSKGNDKSGKGGGGSKLTATVNVSEEQGEATGAKKPLKYCTTVSPPKPCGMLVGESDGELIDLPIKLGTTELNGKVDTGAVCSIVSADLVRKYDWLVKRSAPELSHAAGGKLEVLATLEIETTISLNNRAKTKLVEFVVVENLCTEIIIGLDMIRRFQLVIDVCLDRPIYFRPRRKGVRTIEQQVLKARTITMIRATVDTNASEIATSAFNFDENLTAANSVVKVEKDGRTSIPIANLDTKDHVISIDTQVASFSVIEKQFPNIASKSINQVLALDSQSEDFVLIGDKLDSSQVQDLSNLFKKHVNAFSIGGQLGRCDFVKHEIELLPGSKPFKEPRRKHPPAHADEADRQVSEMISQGILEPSCSPWASEYVMVRKKNNQWRMCIDFRRLNALTKKNAFPLPDVEECLENLAGNMYFSKLDFASGYWQVPVAEESREMTAFRTREGLFQFKVMPFGLTNAPASFQKLINIMFSGLRGITLQLFLDDVCVATKSWSEHVEILEKVFEIVKQANMKLNGKKCEFGLSEIIFLGHKVSRMGIQQDPSKLEALTKLAPPTDVSGVRRILGGFGYYRRFVFNFAAITAPIARLTRKGEPFVWGEEQQESFDQIKSALSTNATLSHLDPEGEILVKTDASRAGIAGLIQQMKDGEWHLITCCSRGLSSSELNYSITELEALAVVYSLNKFRYYLLGRRFKILVDHQALKIWNRSKPPNNERLMRWALVLSDYNCEIVYVKGKSHEDVDLLSRAPVTSTVDDFLPHVLLVRPVDPESWIAAYEDDSWLNKAETQNDGFYRLDRIIYHKDKLFVPPTKRETIMKESHDSLVGAHDGIEATLYRVGEHFWWPGWRADVETYVRRCHVCQLRKVTRRKPPGRMRHHYATRPLEKVAFDHLGKLPSAVTGECFVIVAIDVYSKYVTAKAVEAQTSALVEQFLAEYCACFGVPQSMVTDNSMAFLSSGVKGVAEALGIKMITAVPRHSRGNAVVERAIESVQEKVSLLTHQQPLDWAAALPYAVMSLNTRKHKTTGFTPYQLFFNREAKPTQAAIELKQNRILGEATSLNIEEMHAQAIENTSNAQNASKESFDKNRPEKYYNTGDKVLVKASDRVAKLANKYEGPFEVLSKDNDIYELKNLSGRQEKRMRHVSQMKLYIGIILYAGLIMAKVSTEPIHLHQTSPIYWTEVEDRFVTSGLISIPYLYYYVSPCPLILKYAKMIEETNGVITLRRVTNRNHTAKNQIEEEEHESDRPAPQSNRVIRQVLSNSPLMMATNALYLQCQTDSSKLSHLLKQINVSPEQSQPTRERRQVGFIAGIIVDDLYHLFTQSSHSEASSEKIREMVNNGYQQQQKKVDLLKLAININNKNTQKLATQINRLQGSIEAIPTVEVFANQILMDIRQKKELGERLLISITEKKVDTITLAQFLRTTKIDQLELRDAIISRAESIPPDVVQFEFNGYTRSSDYKVYQVHALSHFTNYTTIPVRNDYEGRTFLIYNIKLDCVKGIDADVSHVILEDCTTKNGRDASLQLWHQVQVPNARKEPRRSVSIPVWPYILVYCWGNRLQVGNEWTDCPPYTCLLNNNKTFKTSDNLVSHTAAGIKSNRVKAILDTQKYHIPYYQPAHLLLNEQMETIDSLTAKVNESIALNWDGTEVTYYHLFLGHSGLLTFILIVGLLFYAFHKVKNAVKWPDWRYSPRPKTSTKEVIHVAQHAAQNAARQVGEELKEHFDSAIAHRVQTEFNRAVIQALPEVTTNNRRNSARRVLYQPRQVIRIDELSNEA